MITKTLGKLVIVGVLAFTVVGAFSATPALAKDGDVKTVGILESRPAGNVGNWVVGGQTFVATSSTQVRPGIVVGDCVKVAVRSGAVHGISEEPMRDCR